MHNGFLLYCLLLFMTSDCAPLTSPTQPVNISDLTTRRPFPTTEQISKASFEYEIPELGIDRVIDRPVKIECPSMPSKDLESLMGQAYNPRYMSLEKPSETGSELAEPATNVLGMLGDQPEEFVFQTPTFTVPANFRSELKGAAPNKFFFVKLVEESQRAPSSEAPERRARLGQALLDYLKTHVNLQQSSNHTQVLRRRSRRRRAVMEYIQRKKPSTAVQRPARNDPPWMCPSRLVWKDLGPRYFPRYLRMVECDQSHHCWFGQWYCRPKSFTVKLLKLRSDECVPVTLEDSNTVYQQEWVWEERALNFCCECSSL